MVVETNHPTLGTIQTLGSPLKFSKTPMNPGRPAPTLGQHTDTVLEEIGMEAAEIADLRRTGAVS